MRMYDIEPWPKRRGFFMDATIRGMKLDFEGNTALVTGALRGTGNYIAPDLAASGATLIVTSTSAEFSDSLIVDGGLTIA